MAARPIASLLAVAAVAAGCGDSDTRYVTVTSSGTTAAAGGTTSTSTTATTQERSFAGFRSPSGNIGCQMDREQVRCDIREKSWEPPAAPAGCEVDYGQGILLASDEPARLVCAGDTALDPGAPALPYGARNVIGQLGCESSASGMTCRDTSSGHGFFISRQSYRLF